jgi:uncharacterized protein (DUF433 family)
VDTAPVRSASVAVSGIFVTASLVADVLMLAGEADWILMRISWGGVPFMICVDLPSGTLTSKQSMMTEIAPRIVVDPGVRFGKPVIRGTRVQVATIVAKLAGGMPIEEIIGEYDLEIEDVQAALHYAAALVAGENLLNSA